MHQISNQQSDSGLLARLFGAKSLAESLGSDYMHDSRRDSFFYAGTTEMFQKIENPIKFQIGYQFASNRHDWSGGTALLVYQISTRYSKPFISCSDLKNWKTSARAHTNTHTHTPGRQLKIIFLAVLDSNTNISIFFHENSFVSEEAKNWKYSKN